MWCRAFGVCLVFGSVVLYSYLISNDLSKLSGLTFLLLILGGVMIFAPLSASIFPGGFFRVLFGAGIAPLVIFFGVLAQLETSGITTVIVGVLGCLLVLLGSYTLNSCAFFPMWALHRRDVLSPTTGEVRLKANVTREENFLWFLALSVIAITICVGMHSVCLHFAPSLGIGVFAYPFYLAGAAISVIEYTRTGPGRPSKVLTLMMLFARGDLKLGRNRSTELIPR